MALSERHDVDAPSRSELRRSNHGRNTRAVACSIRAVVRVRGWYLIWHLGHVAIETVFEVVLFDGSNLDFAVEKRRQFLRVTIS